jgi:signal transduction histidine kinase
VPAGVRLVLLLLCGAVAASTDRTAASLLWLVPLGVAGLVASRAGQRASQLLTTISVEGLLSGLAIAASGTSESPYLPYLIAPAFAGGLGNGLLGGLLPVGTATTALLVATLVDGSSLTAHATSTTAQWVVIAVLVGLVASWVRAVLRERAGDPRAAQAEAFRLLTELRDVTRQLPGTLDPATTGEGMLQRARTLHRYDLGAVLISGVGSRQLTVLVRSGPERPEWDLSLSGRGVLAGCWRLQRPANLPHRLATSSEEPVGGSALVVPLKAGTRTLALLVLESGVAGAFPEDAADRVAAGVLDLVPSLRTGLVFDEVRELATYEERRRLAREIHDGIAQELASLAYALDTVAVDVRESPPVAVQIDTIRDEVRRLVSELRMSLFDLRSEVAPDEGLGAAMSRHLHQVGTASGLTVHLSLNEAPVRLPAETEAELLRIVQEAVANARKHARARNLWVTCTVDPPSASITVEDDGHGLAEPPGAGSHGLSIMRERAARIRADLNVAPRRPHGTKVTLTLDRVRP